MPKRPRRLAVESRCSGAPDHVAPTAPRILGAGLVTLDIVLRTSKRTHVAGDVWEVAHWAGGTCGNVLAALSYLGWRAAPIARLGADGAAEAIVGDLKHSGVDTEWLVREAHGESSRIAQVVTERPGHAPRHRFAFSCPACGAPFARYRPPRMEQFEAVSAAASAGGDIPDVFFFDRVSPAILAMAKWFRRQGALIYFEPSGIGKPAEFREAVEVSHIVKYAHDRLHEPLAVFGGLGRMARRPRVEIETLGVEGLRFRVNDGTARGRQWRRQPAFRVTEVRDAAGAGDWCSAGTLLQLGWRRGNDVEELSSDAVAFALTFGQALAALTCQHVGPRSVTRVVRSGDMLASAAAVQRDGLSPSVPNFIPSLSDIARVSAGKCGTCLRV